MTVQQQMAARSAQEMVVFTQQMQELEELIAEVCISERANISSAIEAVDSVYQKEIDAFKFEIDVLEKTVLVAQKALAASQSRAVENPKMYAAKRQAEQTMEASIKRQTEENRRQFIAMQALYGVRQGELDDMRQATGLCASYSASIWMGNQLPKGMRFVRTYVGEAAYKTMIDHILQMFDRR